MSQTLASADAALSTIRAIFEKCDSVSKTNVKRFNESLSFIESTVHRMNDDNNALQLRAESQTREIEALKLALSATSNDNAANEVNDALRQTIAALHGELDARRSENELLRIALAKSHPDQNNEQLFAPGGSTQHASTQAKSTKKNDTDRICIIEPKESSMSFAEVVKHFKDARLVEEQKIRVERIIDTKKGRTIVKAKTSADKDAIVKAFAGNASITVRNPAPKSIQVILKNVPTNIQDTEIVKEIIERDERAELLSEALSFDKSFKVGGRDTSKHVVLNLREDAAAAIAEEPFFFIGCGCFRVLKYVSIIQCFKCCAYGHKAANCQNEHPTCGWCAGAHSTNQCPKDDEGNLLSKTSCVNCIHSNNQHNTE